MTYHVELVDVSTVHVSVLRSCAPRQSYAVVVGAFPRRT
jgi:hypothetical protein